MDLPKNFLSHKAYRQMRNLIMSGTILQIPLAKFFILAVALVSFVSSSSLFGIDHEMKIDPSPIAEGIKPAAYRLSWHDEFDGDAVNTDTWAYRLDSNWGSTQKQQNVSVGNGRLRIELKKDAEDKKGYTGGGVISKKQFNFGFYEARFIVPRTRGWHTSFWLTGYEPLSPNKVGGIGLQELDICEHDSWDSNVYKPAIWIRKPKDIAIKPKVNGYTKVETPDLTAEFHVWGCEFTAGMVRYFFDGKEVMRRDISAYQTGPNHIWMTSIAANLGKKTGNPVDEELPSRAEFEYVRFWERVSP